MKLPHALKLSHTALCNNSLQCLNLADDKYSEPAGWIRSAVTLQRTSQSDMSHVWNQESTTIASHQSSRPMGGVAGRNKSRIDYCSLLDIAASWIDNFFDFKVYGRVM